jgi:hypothetical protein
MYMILPRHLRSTVSLKKIRRDKVVQQTGGCEMLISLLCI